MQTSLNKASGAIGKYEDIKKINCKGRQSAHVLDERHAYKTPCPCPNATPPTVKDLEFMTDPKLGDCCYKLNCGCPTGSCDIVTINGGRRLAQGASAQCVPANQGRWVRPGLGLPPAFASVSKQRCLGANSQVCGPAEACGRWRLPAVPGRHVLRQAGPECLPPRGLPGLPGRHDDRGCRSGVGGRVRCQ